MSLFRDNVFETSTTQGTGALTLAGAVTGARSFAAAFGPAPATVFYVVRPAVEDGTFECGVGTFTAPDHLARTAVLASSAGGSTVNWGPGTRNVFCAPGADFLTALNRTNKGSSPPFWAMAGTPWLDDGATPWLLKRFDGTDWVVESAIDPAGNAAYPYLAPARLFETTLGAGTATLAFASWPIGFRDVEIRFTNLVPQADGDTLTFQISNDGVAYQTSAFYQQANVEAASSGSAPSLRNTLAGSGIEVARAVGGLTSEGVSGVIRIHGPDSSGTVKKITGAATACNTAMQPNAYQIGGAWVGNTTIVRGVRLFFASSNFAAGSAALYGIR